MKYLAYRILKWRGWSFEGRLPLVPKMIVVGAPHTSNWDFFVFLGALHHFALRVRYLAKSGLFRWPVGPILRSLGGISVEPGPRGLVDRVTREFESSEEMILVIAPEGTRAMARRWRSGFLSIAEAASVPVVLAGLDYRSRTVTIGPTIDFDGDPRMLMEAARSFYADKRGLHPELETPVALEEEEAGPS